MEKKVRGEFRVGLTAGLASIISNLSLSSVIESNMFDTTFRLSKTGASHGNASLSKIHNLNRVKKSLTVRLARREGASGMVPWSVRNIRNVRTQPRAHDKGTTPNAPRREVIGKPFY